MSIPNEPFEPSTSDLQFNEAEFHEAEPGRPVCAHCKKPIPDQYYEASGQLVCPICRQGFEEALHGGSRLARGLKALVLGTIAAAIGAALYYAIMHATGWNIGLVAIVVGVLIGGAVKVGSENRGGWFYQLMALFLTYTAISFMHIPDIIAGFQELFDEAAVEARNAANQEGPPKFLADGSTERVEDRVAEAQENSTGDEDPAAEVEAEAPAHPSEAAALKLETDLESADAARIVMEAVDDQPPTALDWLLGMGALWALAYAFPIFIAINSPISGLIYAFALWESWKINRKTVVAFQGPYSLKARGAIESEGAVDGV